MKINNANCRKEVWMWFNLVLAVKQVEVIIGHLAKNPVSCGHLKSKLGFGSSEKRGVKFTDHTDCHLSRLTRRISI